MAEKSLEERFQDYFDRREKLDREFWAASDKLNDEYDVLMEELRNQ